MSVLKSLTMELLEVVLNLRRLKKVLFVALIVTLGSSVSLVFAVSSEDQNLSSEGTKSYIGENAAVFSFIGKRRFMEDAFAMEENINKLGISLYGVFDGHGGDLATKYTAKNLLVDMKKKIIKIKKQISKRKSAEYTQNGVTNYEEFLKNEIEVFNNNKLLMELDKKKDKSGTTAVIALITDGMLYVANVGHSRAVIAFKEGNEIQASEITTDHVPSNSEEKQRINNSTFGTVVPANDGSLYLYVDYENGENYSFTVSRSLGDLSLINRDCGFIATADTFTVDLSTKQYKFIILATNGLWKAFENSEAVRIIEGHIADRVSSLNAAKHLTYGAHQRNRYVNITTMLIQTT